MTALLGLTLPEIEALVSDLGLKKYRAKQLVDWLYTQQVADFAAMTNISQAERRQLSAALQVRNYEQAAVQQAADGKTSKFLLAFADQAKVETVLMRQPYGNSVCVSTQVGCAMGCAFCASALFGMTRNLTAAEIFAQVYHSNVVLAASGQKVDSIVIMGMGEPLANYDEVLKFIRLLHETYTYNMSYRSITLSTSGLVPEIDRLASENIPLTLSISLHAPNDALRSTIMPINKRYPIAELMAAADRYAETTGRRVTYEYILINDVNDSESCARELGKLLKRRLANVNLIPMNPVPEKGFYRPSPARVKHFEETLRRLGVGVTVRREMGADIQAACGQLRKKHIEF